MRHPADDRPEPEDDESFPVEANDVSLTALELPGCDECEDAPAKQTVDIFLRAIGQTVTIGKYCEDCAQAISLTLRRGLGEK